MSLLGWLRDRVSNRTPWGPARWPDHSRVYVYMDESSRAAELWRPYVVGAVGALNLALGRTDREGPRSPFLLWRGPAPDGYVQEFMRSGHGIAYEILIRADMLDDRKACTEPIYIRRAGAPAAIRSALISLPAAGPPDDAHITHTTALHELGHAIGLGHARHPSSFMWARAHESGGLIMSYEREMLKKAYGEA